MKKRRTKNCVVSSNAFHKLLWDGLNTVLNMKKIIHYPEKQVVQYSIFNFMCCFVSCVLKIRTAQCWECYMGVELMDRSLQDWCLIGKFSNEMY